MALSDLDISKFQMLYKTEFGMNISKEDALEKSIRLLNLVSKTYKPITEIEYQNITNKILQNNKIEN